nr:serine/threonine protein kinase [Verrucomicrobiota bacterium]
MTPERWQQVKGVLGGALEQPNESSRAAFLMATCRDDTALQREVQSLLDQPEDQFDSVAETIGFVNTDPFATANAGRRVGAYELVRELGRGGMGTVWLARRADQHFEKLVAIKLLKRGTDTDEVLGRFHAERQILARLDHPNIARLLDAGTTDDNLPYFVMEYVEGARLTDFVREKKLSLGDCLALFLKICGAVQFAHQNLVVHRDLKPGNILVTADGEPKLLDFGVAKLLAHGDEAWQMTMAGRERFTPGYASPEQVRGEGITTVSDVYSLGALLYEILTGLSPHRFPTSTPTALQIERVVCQGEPARPSVVALDTEMRRQLRGDLDNILLRALAKDPARRYRGAGNLADDLRRYLENRPVRARPDIFGYRAGKFLRRNKTGAAAAILIAAALVAGSITTFWEARRANRRFSDVRRIANSLMFELHDSIKDIPGALRARQLVTQRGLEYLDSLAQEAGNDLSLKSELAVAYDKIGGLTFDVRQAIESHEKAVALNEELVRHTPEKGVYRRQLSDSYDALSDVLIISGQSRRAVDYAKLGLAAAQKLASDRPNNSKAQATLADRYMSLSVALMDAGHNKEGLDAALTAMRRAEALSRDSNDLDISLHLAAIYG